MRGPIKTDCRKPAQIIRIKLSKIFISEIRTIDELEPQTENSQKAVEIVFRVFVLVKFGKKRDKIKYISNLRNMAKEVSYIC